MATSIIDMDPPPDDNSFERKASPSSNRGREALALIVGRYGRPSMRYHREEFSASRDLTYSDGAIVNYREGENRREGVEVGR
jgi:hypothetical protein